MKATLQLSGLAGAVLLTALTGCASIVSGRTADVTVKTNVPNAHVVVRDKRGDEVATAAAPASFTLKRKDRFIFPARYTATIEAPGYKPVHVPIRQTVNPWVLGNVAAGGVIGLAVDNVTGAAWKPKQPNIYQELQPNPSANPQIETAKRLPDPSVQPASAVY